MASSSSVKETPIFADTNLGTRIVIAVSPEIIAKDFKGLNVPTPFAVEFERAHSNCFPELGEIRVSRIKVKGKSCLYHLSESFPPKHFFHSSKGQFFHIEVYRLQDQSGCAERPAAENRHHFSDFQHVTSKGEIQNFVPTTTKNSKRSKRKKSTIKRLFCFKAALLKVSRAAYFVKRKKKRCNKIRTNTAANIPKYGPVQGPHLSKDESHHFASTTNGECGKESNVSQPVECPSETLSETISVSGIIKRYFGNYDEVTSNSRFSAISENEEHSLGETAMNTQGSLSSPLNAKSPSKMLYSHPLKKPCSEALGDTHGKLIGTRLIAASNNLGLSRSKQKSTLSIYKIKDGRSAEPKSTTPVRTLLFEMTDDEC